jgi:eukaryotic-like serine/threonine-protein kinase
MKSRHNRSWALASSNRSSETSSPLYDGRVVAALEEYVELLRDGWRPDRAEFLARHHSLGAILGDRLDDLDFVQGAMSAVAATGPHGPVNVDSAGAPGRLGEYRIIREIGRGGMGVVYEAEQLPLGRHVALKVLPTTASLDPRQCERFQVEAHAAGLLHHEHIVPIFGIGCDQGIHFYAMQFIVGRSLTEVIQGLRPAPSLLELAETKNSDNDRTFELGPAQQAAAFPTGSSLNNRQHCKRVAQLGLQAALALEHAHEIGVIHRDIKPSNLLIDDRDHLWVADFGLARLPHDDHDLTRTGDLVGTLRYMSPEQVRGERGTVDARSDIYALGATLYELLTLRPAFLAGDRHQLLGQILEDEPVKPRRFNTSIPRDLETIVLKAMEKEPSARYESARAMADDLRRLLADQPIQARRPSFIDQSIKWARRHRAAVVASTVAMLVTLASSTAVLWASKGRLETANRRLESAQAVTRVQVNSAHSTIDFSLFAVDQILQRLKIDSKANAPEDAKRVLTMAIQYYDRVAKEYSHDERNQEVGAKALRQAGRIRMNLGGTRGRDDYREAIEIYEDIAARYPKNIWLRAGLITTLDEYAGLLNLPDDAVEADASFRRSLAVAEGLIGNKDADAHCFSTQLVGPFNNLAWDLVCRRTPAHADDTGLAVRLARKAVEWEPEQPAYWNTLGVAQYRAGDFAAAERSLQTSIKLSEGGTAVDWLFLACIKHHQGDRGESRRWFDQAVEWLRQNPVHDSDESAQLIAFRDEAAELLGPAIKTTLRGKTVTSDLGLNTYLADA